MRELGIELRREGEGSDRELTPDLERVK
jgi:hypothetical protein